MRKILISSYSMEVGGVERSLINMLENFDNENNEVDLMLYKHKGDLLELIPDDVNLLDEIRGYNSFGVPISNLLKTKQFHFGVVRILAKLISKSIQTIRKVDEIAYYQVQLMRKLSNPFLPKLDREYEVAISYYWPHYSVADKVKAKKKIAWIHTDYSTIYTHIKMDYKMWNKFDHIIAISKEAKKSFLKKYPQLTEKVLVVENITSPKYITEMSNGLIDDKRYLTSGIRILTVARLSHAKGIDNAIRALKLLKNKGIKNITWFVIGFGGEEEYIKELIKELKLEDCFILLGKKVNPYPYMKNCDLYIQPSRYEGKAVTVTEAQILGKPVLVTKYPTANSQVNDGKDGIITEQSIEGIADGIEKMINDKELLERLKKYTSRHDYSNKYELEKLYKLF